MCASRASRPHASPRARVPLSQFNASDYLPGGEYPVHDERDALRALLRGLGSEYLRTPTFLTSYSPVCDQTSSAYFVEFNMWTPGARGGARDSGSGGCLEARPLVAYRPSDPEPWVLFAGASPPSEESCDWHEAVQELFSRVGPGQLRSDYQTLEAACLAHTPPSAAEAARCLSDFLKRKKLGAAKARVSAAETRVALAEARAKLLNFEKLVGMHLVKYEWRPPVGDAEPQVLYTLCTVAANREVTFAPERTYKELTPEECAYINSRTSGPVVMFDPKNDLVDAAQLEKSVQELEAKLARLAALTDDEYDRLKWLRDAAEALADFFTAKLLTTVPRGPRQARTGGFPAPPDRAAKGAGAVPGAGGGAGADELSSDSEGRKPDPFAWSEGEEEEEEKKLAKPPRGPPAKRMREDPGAMRTCKFNYRTGKRCGGGLKPDNSVRCMCRGIDCRAQKRHTGLQCRSGAHIRCLLEDEMGDDGSWVCRECQPVDA